MKSFFHNLFNYTSRERNGTIVLIIILMIITGIRLWIAYRPEKKITRDLSQQDEHITAWEQQLTEKDPDQKISSVFLAEEVFDEPELFYFDPNTATEEELIRLGIQWNVCRTLVNYRIKGGRFRQSSDLKKVYGLTEEDYARLEPYIVIRSDHSDMRTDTVTESRDVFMPLELNSADTSDLKALKGIGSILSNRIVKFRRLLGGFYSADQLREVYGISDSLYLSLRPLIVIEPATIEKINVNTADHAHLAKHPYIGTYYAEGILLYRTEKGRINGFDELVKNNLLPPEHLEKIIYYIDF